MAQAFIELPKIVNDANLKLDPLIFFSNAAAAFGEPQQLLSLVFGSACASASSQPCL